MGVWLKATPSQPWVLRRAHQDQGQDPTSTPDRYMYIVYTCMYMCIVVRNPIHAAYMYIYAHRAQRVKFTCTGSCTCMCMPYIVHIHVCTCTVHVPTCILTAGNEGSSRCPLKVRRCPQSYGELVCCDLRGPSLPPRPPHGTRACLLSAIHWNLLCPTAAGR